MDSPPMFNSVEDECRYWKERAKLYHKEWTDVKQEFDEYVEQSRQMEAEMDATLEQKQNSIKDLRIKVANLEKENDSLRMKQDSHIIEFANVEKQLETVKTERDSMKQYLRQLEQKNDDLERAHRILNESIAYFETMLDKEYEKNALLEVEVDEKEKLQVKLQRLMDETRDLKQELNIKTRYPSTTPNGVAESSVLSENLSNPTIATIPTGNSQSSLNEYNQNSLKNPDNMLNGNAAAMTASSRTTALNIVADMLRKLNAMETKLKAYREQPQSMQPRQ
ncbi:nuclear distribution protein nudE homolog isoform X2 [Eupeodes corollae]|uniref:nuclear distribution protein nudE homolog isoform X2 n=1 Tax=Eupeodes corollae TaxID=290404 RepID=UPI0024939EA8|nr:nuclear distribution protein nudE homolog isoform X2 [Eupeodes corollae]